MKLQLEFGNLLLLEIYLSRTSSPLFISFYLVNQLVVRDSH